MTTTEAKEVLLRYRPGVPVIEDAALSEALELARHDPALAAWLQAHVLRQQEIVATLRGIQTPPDLRARLVSVQARRPAGWLKPFLISASVAAGIVLLLSWMALWHEPREQQTLAAFQGRMVSFALREYSMDIVTNDVSAVRKFLQQEKAPSEFPLPGPLSKTEVKGGARLAWQNHPVAMVCFKLDEKETLYLFVLKAEVFKNGVAAEQAEIKQISRLATATWRNGDNIYFMAGNAPPEVLKRFLAVAHHHADLFARLGSGIFRPAPNPGYVAS